MGPRNRRPGRKGGTMKAVVTGAGGFIGGHLCRLLKEQGYWVKGVDISHPRYGAVHTDEFHLWDMRTKRLTGYAFEDVDVAFCMAADMGGMGYIGLPENQFQILWNNFTINLTCARAAGAAGVKSVFFASSACAYPGSIQEVEYAPALSEDLAWLGKPDTHYGIEKLASEDVWTVAAQHFGFDVAIARFHNVYGPHGSWNDGREKAPAALCRKVAECKLGLSDEVVIWGDGEQVRSFCYIDDCLMLIQALMDDGYPKPVNIGSDEAVTINELTEIVMDVAQFTAPTRHDLDKPQGVRRRNADLELMEEVTGLRPKVSLREGIERTYPWIEQQVKENM